MTTATPKHVALYGQMAALSLFGLKEAQHAFERLNQRTELSPEIIPLLEAEADKLSGKVPEGFYYLPLTGSNGEVLAYAAFKTVPAYPHPRLVLATILGPHMNPKGSSLSHVMMQPKLASVFNADDVSATPYDRVVRRRFNDLAETMRSQGAFAGTAHKRIVIPKDRLTEQDINSLGFTPVTVAIPEAGQDRFQSFRHHENNFHIHSHPEGWTMHEDGHPAATMLAKKAKGLGDKTKAMISGIPHMSEEGLPGLYYYVKGAIGGHRSTAERVFRELPTEVKLKLYGMAPSPTAIAQNLKQELEAKRDKLADVLGIPDRKEFGDPLALKEGDIVDWVVQRHEADRAGPHYDVRFGTKDVGLLSWATKKELPKPGERIALFQQPVHDYDYKDFTGVIEKGYGKGSVKLHESGQLLVTKVNDDAIHLTTAHTRYPERLVFIKPKDGSKQWLLVNSTPSEPLTFEKEHFVSVKPENGLEVLQSLPRGSVVQPKVDGASVLVQLHKDKLDVFSWRVSKETGRPIVHTERIFHGHAGLDVPKEYVGSVLWAELYGVKDGRVIPPQALGGLLNSGVAKSIAEQKANDIQLKHMLFGVKSIKGKTTETMPLEERQKFLEAIAKHLPANKFELAEEARTPAAAVKLYKQIQSGKHPLTVEGVVIHSPHRKPVKIKLVEEKDVYITGTFPGEGKFKNSIGGFTYGLSPDGKTVGRVGTGFSDAFRKEVAQTPENYIGRTAKIRAQSQLPSGAYRVPALVAVHEDYPSKTASALLGALIEVLREKVAEITTELKPHQQRVVDRMKDPNQPGLIAVHGLGSGKTLTSIAVADALKMPADVVVPAALQANYAKEMMKHTTTPPDARILSMENTARKGSKVLERPLMIVDEAHRLRNPGKTQTTLMHSPAQKKLLLTGSLVYNHPSDMAPLVNMVAGEKTLPQNPSEFEGRYIRERQVGPGLWGSLRGAPSSTKLEVNPRTKEELRQILKKYVDYHPGSTEGFPSREDQVIRVEMTEHQRKLDDALLQDLPPWAREKILKNLPPTKSEAKQLNTFMNGIRQNANTTRGFDLKTDPQQPKIDRAVQELQKILESNPHAKAVVYSNYLNSGINPYKEELAKHKIPYGEFSGQMTKTERDDLVRQYNEDKLKALLLSSAGGEGLDLKGTNLIQVLEPHWNEEKIKQVIGRGIRFKSHDHLPEAQRKILVQRFLATRPRVGMLERMKFKDPGGSADEYLYNRSNEKEQLNQQFRALLN
jgi:hypothetical protein